MLRLLHARVTAFEFVDVFGEKRAELAVWQARLTTGSGVRRVEHCVDFLPLDVRKQHGHGCRVRGGYKVFVL